MRNKTTSCSNCHSNCRCVKARNLCGKCYYWQKKIENCSQKLNLVQANPQDYRKYSTWLLPFQIRRARRALEELRWRGEGLLAKSTDADRLFALISLLASCCHSQVATDAETAIAKMSPKYRRQIYEVLLPIIEKYPSRYPKLHTPGGWSGWQTEHTLSPAFSDDVKLGRALEKAYYDSIQ